MAIRPKIVYLVIGRLLMEILSASAQGPGPLPDSAHYRGGDTQLPVTTMIDGTVQSMNANLLIIDGMNVQVAPNTRLLNVMRVGDLVHVEDNLVVDGDTPRIVAVYLTIPDMDVAINTTVWSGVTRVTAETHRRPGRPQPAGDSAAVASRALPEAGAWATGEWVASSDRPSTCRPEGN
jgi:hypothetical protein